MDYRHLAVVLPSLPSDTPATSREGRPGAGSSKKTIAVATLGVAVAALLVAGYTTWLGQRNHVQAFQQTEAHNRTEDLRAERGDCRSVMMAIPAIAGTPKTDEQLRTIQELASMAERCEQLGIRLGPVATLALARLAREGNPLEASAARRALAKVDVSNAPRSDTPIGDLVGIAAYGGGAVLAGTGLLNFKKHVDNPSTNELRKAIDPAKVGIALLAFPTMAGYLDSGAAPSGKAAGAFTARF